MAQPCLNINNRGRQHMATDKRIDILIKAIDAMGTDYYIQIVVMDDEVETWFPRLRRKDCKD
jgi:hypothetical protein